MRKFLGFATLIAALAFATAIWTRSGAVVSTDAIGQTRAAISPYEMMSTAKNLPAQEIAEYF